MNVMKLNLTSKTISTLYLLASALIIFYPILMLLQIETIHTIIIDSKIIKIFVALFSIIIVILGFKFRLFTYQKDHVKFVIIYLFFLFYNFIVIFICSDHYQISEVFLAFTYNYSLFIFFVPLLFISKICPNKTLLKSILGIIMIGDFIAIIQFITNSYIYQDYVIQGLQTFDAIKVDHLAGNIRAFGFFKSPLELGIINSMIGIIMLYKYYFSKKNINMYLIIYSISVLATVATVSRTAILIFFIGSINVIIHFFMTDSKRLQKYGIALLFPLLTFMVYLKTIFSATATATATAYVAPKNFFIRLENWFQIISNFSINEFIFGQGIVQNGNFDKHAFIIDNTYLGVIVTGGLIGMFLFIYIVKRLYVMYQNYYDSKTPLISLLVAFLIGGMTENMMHIAYFLLFPLVFMNIKLHSES